MKSGLVYIFLAFFLVTFLVYMAEAGNWQLAGFYRMLFLLPLLFSAYTYGRTGAYTAFLAASSLYFPLLAAHFKQGITPDSMDLLMSLLLFAGCAFPLGILSEVRKTRQAEIKTLYLMTVHVEDRTLPENVFIKRILGFLWQERIFPEIMFLNKDHNMSVFPRNTSNFWKKLLPLAQNLREGLHVSAVSKYAVMCLNLKYNEISFGRLFIRVPKYDHDTEQLFVKVAQHLSFHLYHLENSRRAFYLNALLDLVFESVDFALLVLDKDDKVVFKNTSAENILSVRLGSDGRVQWSAPLTEFFEKTKTKEEASEQILLNSDGRTVPVDIRLFRIKAQSLRIVCAENLQQKKELILMEELHAIKTTLFSEVVQRCETFLTEIENNMGKIVRAPDVEKYSERYRQVCVLCEAILSQCDEVLSAKPESIQ